MKCEFCNNEFSNKQNLNTHQTKTKYCLKIQGISDIETYLCKNCDKSFTKNFNYNRHIKICKKTKINNNLEKTLEIRNIEIIELKKENKILKSELEKYRSDYKELSTTAISSNFEQETTIDIDDTLSESRFTVCDSDSEYDDYELTPLEVGKGFIIEHREDDGI